MLIDVSHNMQRRCSSAKSVGRPMTLLRTFNTLADRSETFL